MKFAYLFREGDQILLEFYPADTLEQAKIVYGEPWRVERLLALRRNGWQMAPNFHFGYIAKGLT